MAARSIGNPLPGSLPCACFVALHPWPCEAHRVTLKTPESKAIQHSLLPQCVRGAWRGPFPTTAWTAVSGQQERKTHLRRLWKTPSPCGIADDADVLLGCGPHSNCCCNPLIVTVLKMHSSSKYAFAQSTIICHNLNLESAALMALRSWALFQQHDRIFSAFQKAQGADISYPHGKVGNTTCWCK